jgi:predicted N-acetyltransferase YhbS
MSVVGWRAYRLAVSDGVSIRVATKDDLGALVRAFGQRQLFADRIGRTRQRAGELLVAWAGSEPIGNVYLWCEALEEPELRAAFPGVPLLNHLEVKPARQRRGVGSALVRAGEDAARRRGHDVLLLGVAVDNEDARRLYRSLGYVDWGKGALVSRWTEPDGRGGIREASLTIDVMVRSLNAPPVTAWTPWTPGEIAARLSGVSAPWHVAGGWALELWRADRGLGALREHHDVEIAVPRRVARGVTTALRAHGLSLYSVWCGGVWPLRGDVPRPPRWQVWAAEADTYRMDVFMQPGDARTWIFRKDERLRRAYAEAVDRSAQGIPFLRPECVLLFKAIRPRPQDEADFEAMVPALDRDARRWLATALRTVAPRHPWLGAIRASGGKR